MTIDDTWLSGVTLPRLAADWTDRSLLAFAAPQFGTGLSANITMSRDERVGPGDPPGESFDGDVQRQLQLLEANLPGFQSHRPTPLSSGTSEARDVLFTWRSGAVSLTHWVVWMVMQGTTVATFTAPSDSSQYEANRPQFESTLRSVRIEPAVFPTGAGY